MTIRLDQKFDSSKVKAEFHDKPVEFLGGNNWLHMYRFADSGYTFSHEPKWDDIGVGILPYRMSEDKGIEFLAVLEKRPVHGDQFKLYALTGGHDNTAITPAECALKELKEESGYIGSLDQIVYFGEFNNTKMSTASMHLFAIDVTNLEQGAKTTDGSVVEQTAQPVWVGFHKLILEGDNLLSRMMNLLDLHFDGKGGFSNGRDAFRVAYDLPYEPLATVTVMHEEDQHRVVRKFLRNHASVYVTCSEEHGIVVEKNRFCVDTFHTTGKAISALEFEILKGLEGVAVEVDGIVTLYNFDLSYLQKVLDKSKEFVNPDPIKK